MILLAELRSYIKSANVQEDMASLRDRISLGFEHDTNCLWVKRVGHVVVKRIRGETALVEPICINCRNPSNVSVRTRWLQGEWETHEDPDTQVVGSVLTVEPRTVWRDYVEITLDLGYDLVPFADVKAALLDQAEYETLRYSGDRKVKSSDSFSGSSASFRSESKSLLYASVVRRYRVHPLG